MCYTKTATMQNIPISILRKISIGVLSFEKKKTLIPIYFPSGRCSVCQNTLQTVQITDEEFITLRKEFLNNVVKGADIYHKTTPKEWQSFEQVIKKHGPFDIVMDGLNVSHGLKKSNSKPCAFLVIPISVAFNFQ